MCIYQDFKGVYSTDFTLKTIGNLTLVYMFVINAIPVPPIQKQRSLSCGIDLYMNPITQQVKLSSEILTKQRELIPNNPNVEANTQLKLGIADYSLALGFYKKGWAEEDSYYLTMGDIYLDSADSYIFYYKLYREGC